MLFVYLTNINLFFVKYVFWVGVIIKLFRMGAG